MRLLRCAATTDVAVGLTDLAAAHITCSENICMNSKATSVQGLDAANDALHREFLAGVTVPVVFVHEKSISHYRHTCEAVEVQASL